MQMSDERSPSAEQIVAGFAGEFAESARLEDVVRASALILPRSYLLRAMSSIAQNTNNAGPNVGAAFKPSYLLNAVSNQARTLYSGKEYEKWDPLIIGFRHEMIRSFKPMPFVRQGINPWTIAINVQGMLAGKGWDAGAGIFPAEINKFDRATTRDFGLLLVVYAEDEPSEWAFLRCNGKDGTRNCFGAPDPQLAHCRELVFGRSQTGSRC